MKILITGHRGFVGRHYHKVLQDHDLTLVDIVEGDDARAFFQKNDITYDLVIHLAAVVGGRQMIERQPLALAVDLSIDAEMAGWAVRTRPRQIIISHPLPLIPQSYKMEKREDGYRSGTYT